MAKRKDQAEAPAGAAARPKRARKAAEAAVAHAQAVAAEAPVDAATAAREECAEVAAAARERASKRRPMVAYSDQVVEAVLERLAEGESLRSICRDDGMPSRSCWLRWVEERPELAARYAQAKEVGLELMADELLDIADDATNDYMERFDRNGQSIGYEVNGEAIQRSKVRLETRRWLLERLAAKKYGANSTVTHKGAIGVAQVEVDDDQARRVAQAILDGMNPEGGA